MIVLDYIGEYIMKIYVKSNSDKWTATQELSKMPPELAGCVIYLGHWLNGEKCGYTKNLDDAEQFIYSRTVDNPRSDWSKHNPDKCRNAIAQVFDYARNNGLTVDQLCKMGGVWSRYSSRTGVPEYLTKAVFSFTPYK